MRSGKERFKKNVRKRGTCLIWTSTILSTGYGQLRFQGKKLLAHRFAWMIFRGEIPEGLQVCHRCDTPGCVRPSHLFLATQQGNMDDMRRKGRDRKAHGKTHYAAKLTDQQVAQLRRARSQGQPIAALARKYGLSIGAVSMIANRRRRKAG